MWQGKIPQFYLLMGLYGTFGAFVLVTFDRSLDTGFYLIVFACFSAAWVAILRERLILLYYVNIMALSVFMYSIQRELGPEYLMFRTQNSMISERAALIFIGHIIFTTLGAVLTPLGHQPNQPIRPLPLSTALSATIITAVLVVAVVLVVGTQFYTQVRIERAIAGVEIDAVTRILEFFSKSVLYVLASGLILMAPRSRPSPIIWGIAALVLIGALVLSNPVNTARFISLSGMFMVGIALIFRFELHRNLPTLVVLMPLFLTLALPMTSILRLGTDLFSLETAYDMFTSLEFSAFQLYLDAVIYFSVKDLFSTYTLSAIFIMVPRSLWVGKEDAIGNEIAMTAGYMIETVSLPSFFNFFADYGFVGLILGSMAVGWLFTWLDLARVTRLDFRSRRQMYGLVILALVPIIARGDMSTATIAIYAFLASYEVIRLLIRLTIGAPAAASARF